MSLIKHSRYGNEICYQCQKYKKQGPHEPIFSHPDVIVKNQEKCCVSTDNCMAAEETHRCIITPEIVTLCVCTFKTIDVLSCCAILQRVRLACIKKMRSKKIKIILGIK